MKCKYPMLGNGSSPQPTQLVAQQSGTLRASLLAKEKFICNLLSPEKRPGQVTLIYIVYRTIERNGGITLSQLTWLLKNELMLNQESVGTVLASLTSKTLFNCVSRWQPQKNRRTEAVHLRVVSRPTLFDDWLQQALTEFPELEVFDPPIFLVKSGDHSQRAHLESNKPERH